MTLTYNNTIYYKKKLSLEKLKFLKLEKKKINDIFKLFFFKFIKFSFSKKITLNLKIFQNIKFIQNFIIKKFNTFFFLLYCKFLTYLNVSNIHKKIINNFYIERKKKCGIVKTFFYFTNSYLILTDIKGRIKGWLSGGTIGFNKMITRRVPKLPLILAKRMSNLIRRKYFKYIKIQHTGPSTRYRTRIFSTLKYRSWFRGYRISCIEESFSRAFNGCRLRRAKRKKGRKKR